MPEAPLILVVDDEADFREIISAYLKAGGCEVQTAENGELGLKKAKEIKPDLIVLDMKMPVMDGATMLATLRQDPEIKDMKVVFLSSFGDARKEFSDADRHFSRELGALDYINKTEIGDTLAGRIKAFLK